MSASPTLIDIIHSRARSHPNADALVDDGRRLTWAGLDQRLLTIAEALRGTGVRPGDRVAILGANSAAWIETFLGIHAAGGVAVPLNQRLGALECSRLLHDAGVTALAADPDLAGTTSFTGPVLSLRHECAQHREAPPTAAPHGAPQANDLAVIAYTGGTTGEPKGVMWSHGTLMASARRNPFADTLAGGRRVLLAAPLGAGGAVVMAANALAIGATLVIARFTPEIVLRALAEDAIEFTGLVPTMLAMLVEAAPRGWHPRALRRIYYGAGTMAPRLFERAQALCRCAFQQGYGMTETCILGTRLDPDDHTLAAPERLASAGKPMAAVEVKVVDECGLEVAAGTAGEILIRSPGNMLGYWNQAAESQRALANGWYWTRDIGRYDAAGYLYLLDRKDDLVKSGGLSVSPAEVEEVLGGHPAVEEVAVIGVPDTHWGQRVAAVVRTRAGTGVRERDLMALCRARLAGYKNPRTIIFAETPLPRNALGKLNRQALRSQYRGQATP